MKIQIKVVDDKLIRKLEAYPDELLLSLTDAVREITKSAEKSAKNIIPIDTTELLQSVKVENPAFNGNTVVGALTASAPHAYVVHETMLPAGGFLIPRPINMQRGGPEGHAGGWYFKRVFDFGENLKAYHEILKKVTQQSWKDNLRT